MSDPQVKSSPAAFPSLPLIVLSVISRIVATAAFISSLTQVDTHFGYSTIPSTLGFLATIPYHVHLHRIAQEHRKSPSHSDPIFVTHTWIIVSFILIPLWAAIFYTDIQFLSREGAVPGIILTAIWSGIEWVILFCIALKCTRELDRAGPSDARSSSTVGQSIDAKKSDIISLKSNVTARDWKPPRLIYLASFVLCALNLVLSVDIYYVRPVNVIIFFLTAPHHIALYVSYIRPQYPTSILSRPTSSRYAVFLVAFWCGVLTSDILASRFEIQGTLPLIFAEIECAVLAYLAYFRIMSDHFTERHPIEL